MLDYLTQSPQDPLCCPSMHLLRTYRLEEGAPRLVSEQLLVSADEVATPVPALIDIDQPQMYAGVAGPFEVRGRIEPAEVFGSILTLEIIYGENALLYGRSAVQVILR